MHPRKFTTWFSIFRLFLQEADWHDSSVYRLLAEIQWNTKGCMRAFG